MLKYESQDIEFIKKHFDNADEILSSNNADFVLDTLHDFIDMYGFDDYDYNDLGEEAQKIYDSIHYNNPIDYNSPRDYSKPTI